MYHFEIHFWYQTSAAFLKLTKRTFLCILTSNKTVPVLLDYLKFGLVVELRTFTVRESAFLFKAL
jgi:hypothetical protein